MRLIDDQRNDVPRYTVSELTASIKDVLEVEFENGEKAIIPRANVEMIES